VKREPVRHRADAAMLAAMIEPDPELQPAESRPALLMRVVRFLLLINALLACVWLGGHPQYLPAGLRGVFTASDAYQEGKQIIKDRYFRALDGETIDRRALQAAAAQDPFSRYMAPAELEDFELTQRAAYGGVGIEFATGRKHLRVSRVTRGAPAAAAGITPGDVLVAVDGRPVARQDPYEISDRIRGPVGDTVTLTVRSRDGRQRDVPLTRAELRMDIVRSKPVGTGSRRTVIVALYAFLDGAAQQTREALDRGLRAGARRVVLDLRDNPGGLVDEAVRIASSFLPEGSEVVTLRGRAVADRTYRAAGSPIAHDIPVVVLTDENTASAAEIVAGALQDSGRAQLIGGRTYGKGVYQQLFEMKDGGAIDLTVGSYFTPAGRNLGRGTGRGTGLTPDVAADDDLATARDETVGAAMSALDQQP
jgi:carboxyl-terminal processing protease